MKKIISFLMAIIIAMTSMNICVSAAGENMTTTYEYVVDDIEYTVEFEDNTLSKDEQEKISRRLVGLEEMSSQSRGILCIFGHNKSTSTVTVTTHKVRQYSPRCQKDVYDVTICSRCDYTEKVLTSTYFSVCCPED